MQLYVSDFLADTISLSAEEVGAYFLLLAAMWNADGELPADERKIARIARVSLNRWRKIRVSLEPFFYAEDGRLISPHVKKWFSKASAFGRNPLSAALRSTILNRDGERCHYCGSGEGPFHVDHVMPVARGGTDELGNLVIACKSCNLSKGSKLLEEWKP